MKGGVARFAVLRPAVAALLLCALAPLPALAGTIWKCETADGSLSYVSKRVPRAKCSAVTSFVPGRSSPPPAAAPAATQAAAAPAPASARSGSITSTSGAAAAGVATARSIHDNPPARFMGGDEPQAAATPTVATPAAAPVAAAAPAARGSRMVQGQVYSYVKDGIRHYTSKPPPGKDGATAVRTIKYAFIETCYACGATPGVNFGSVRLNTTAYAAEVQSAAREFGVDEAVVRAIMHAESAFNPNALSRVGAQGLMQLMPATAARFGVVNAFDPGQNIRGGVEYLAWLLKRFNGDLTLAAAGYNAGEGAVDRHKGVPPYSETQRYVQRVGLLAERYRGVAAGTQ